MKAPVATKSFSVDLNLNAAATAGPPPDTFSNSINVYDSLGESHTVTVTFTKNATAGQWDYSITVPDADLTNPPYTPVTGSVNFDSNGKLVTPGPADPAPQIVIQGLADGASDMSINWNLYNGATPRITQYGEPSSPSAAQQDGSPCRSVGPRRRRRRRCDSGAIFGRWAGPGRPTGHGRDPEPGVADRRGKQ